MNQQSKRVLSPNLNAYSYGTLGYQSENTSSQKSLSTINKATLDYLKSEQNTVSNNNPHTFKPQDSRIMNYKERAKVNQPDYKTNLGKISKDGKLTPLSIIPSSLDMNNDSSYSVSPIGVYQSQNSNNNKQQQQVNIYQTHSGFSQPMEFSPASLLTNTNTSLSPTKQMIMNKNQVPRKNDVQLSQQQISNQSSKNNTFSKISLNQQKEYQKQQQQYLEANINSNNNKIVIDLGEDEDEPTEILQYGIKNNEDQQQYAQKSSSSNNHSKSNNYNFDDQEDSSFDSDNCNFNDDLLEETNKGNINRYSRGFGNESLHNNTTILINQANKIIDQHYSTIQTQQKQSNTPNRDVLPMRSQKENQVSSKAASNATTSVQQSAKKFKGNYKKALNNLKQQNRSKSNKKLKENNQNMVSTLSPKNTTNKSKGLPSKIPSQMQSKCETKALNSRINSKRQSINYQDNSKLNTGGRTVSQSPEKQEDEIESQFCKKYSRIKVNEEDVFKRQQFESYKRLTKEIRVEKFKTSISPCKETLSPRQKKECFDRLSQDADRRIFTTKHDVQGNQTNRSNQYRSQHSSQTRGQDKNTDDSLFRDESSAKRKQRRMSAKRAQKLYQQKVIEYEEMKQQKLRKLEQDVKLKELEDYFGKYQKEKINKVLSKEVISEQEAEKIYQRQWKDHQRRLEKQKILKEQQQLIEKEQLSRMFKPQLDKSERSFHLLKSSKKKIQQRLSISPGKVGLPMELGENSKGQKNGIERNQNAQSVKKLYANDPNSLDLLSSYDNTKSSLAGDQIITSFDKINTPTIMKNNKQHANQTSTLYNYEAMKNLKKQKSANSLSKSGSNQRHSSEKRFANNTTTGILTYDQDSQYYNNGAIGIRGNFSQQNLKSISKTSGIGNTSSIHSNQTLSTNNYNNNGRPTLVDKLIDQRISKVTMKLDQVIQEINIKKNQLESTNRNQQLPGLQLNRDHSSNPELQSQQQFYNTHHMIHLNTSDDDVESISYQSMSQTNSHQSSKNKQDKQYMHMNTNKYRRANKTLQSQLDDMASGGLITLNTFSNPGYASAVQNNKQNNNQQKIFIYESQQQNEIRDEDVEQESYEHEFRLRRTSL
ncbi:UNKNOWN [Stylonychia lemnae]|uniref:Uncharacterized protein n=1 Tax=Stylonychia lemnae TaxID=5949 RepID=A0A077ZXT8_STYLE|nr:UNKNOWN [Stylonychia lemnae]|eukprot:CDW74052.1 UNKNOWN [Stylonychia lemnae]